MTDTQTPPRFSIATLTFLEKAGRQKNPNWLENNREEYEKVLVKPLKHLALHLKTNLAREASLYHFPFKGIGRLKRPSNRITEKGDKLFRDWMTYSAARPATSRFEHNPNLFFLLNPEDRDDSVLVAGGLYMPSSSQVKAIRHAIGSSPAFATKLDRLFVSKEFSKCFKGGFSTEKKSSRIPRGFEPNHRRIEWIKLQAFFVWRSYSRKEFTSPQFAERVERDWRQILRLNALLENALKGPSALVSSEKKESSKTKNELTDRLADLDDINHTHRAMDF